MNKPKTTVKPYIPENAKINDGNNPMQSPETEYEKRRMVIDRNAVEKSFGIKDINYEE